MNKQDQKPSIDTAAIFESTSSSLRADSEVDSDTKEREKNWKDQHKERDSNTAHDQKTDLHKLRKTHAWCLFGLIVFWIVMLWILLFIKGFLKDEFDLDPSVIIAAITSTTASVLGLYGIAAYWMFGKKANANDDTQEI